MLQTAQLFILVAGVVLVMLFGTREMKLYFAVAFGAILAVGLFALLVAVGGLVGAGIAFGLLLAGAGVAIHRRWPGEISELFHRTRD